MLATALYVKTHNVTGLKYIGKTTQINNIHTYRGSGPAWRKHLKQHGNNYTTELLGIWQDEDRIRKYAKEFCIKNNVVKSAAWANQRLESVIGGALNGDENIAKRPEVRQKMCEKSARNCLGKFGENHPSFSGWYITPNGKFPSLNEAALNYGSTLQNIHYAIFGRHYKIKGVPKFTKPRLGFSFQPK